MCALPQGRAFARKQRILQPSKTKKYWCAIRDIARYCAIFGDTRRSFTMYRKFPLEQGSVALCGRSAERGRAARREAGTGYAYGGIWRDMAGDTSRYRKRIGQTRAYSGPSSLVRSRVTEAHETQSQRQTSRRQWNVNTLTRHFDLRVFDNPSLTADGGAAHTKNATRDREQRIASCMCRIRMQAPVLCETCETRREQ